MPDNPFLDVAIDATAPSDGTNNVASSLEFLLVRTLSAKDAALCYSPDLIKAAAAAPGIETREASRRLKAIYGKDLNLQQWQADVRDVRASLATAQPSNLLQSENGSTKPILANAIIQLRNSKVDLAFDSFSAKVVMRSASPWGSCGLWRDIDDISASNHLQHSGVAVSSAIANEAAFFLAHQNEFHPVRDWLTSLHWDGEPRLDSWLVDYIGAKDEAYVRKVGAKWMISAVARIIKPGCKADYMIVVEGPQRRGKSRVLRALTNGHLDGDRQPQWFRDALPDIEKDDIGLYMQGVWIIEIAELEAIRGKQWTKVKAFISSQTDTFRRKFGRNMQDYPRQCVFAASTNEEQWGGDPTGLTRFWPVWASSIDVDGLLKVREQLWAEARFRHDEGETWWLDEESETLARDEQVLRQPDDSWIDRVVTAIGLNDDVSVAEVLDKLNERHGNAENSHVARALSAMGWERYRPSKNGVRSWRYRHS